MDKTVENTPERVHTWNKLLHMYIFGALFTVTKDMTRGTAIVGYISIFKRKK